MSSEESKRKRYTEEEFALILRKASEIQESPRRAVGEGGEGTGLTLEEIQSIAQEAGIDSTAVAKAAALLGTLEWEEKVGLAARIFGGPGKYNLSFQVPGRMPQEELGRILELIRKETAHQGKAEEVFGGVEWKTVGDLSAVSVNLTPRGDSTSIQIVGDRSGAGALAFTFPVAGAAVLVGALGAIFEPTSAVGIISLVTGVLGSGLLLGRTLWATGNSKFSRKLSGLMNALSGEVERVSVSPTSLPAGGTGGEDARGSDSDEGP